MDSKTKSTVEELLVNEGLTYNLPSSATVVVEKNQKVYFPHKSEYKDTENRIIVTLNSGSDFIDGKNSYLALNLSVQGTHATPGSDFVTFGDGSAVNLFDEIVIRSRDGAEVERIRKLNSLVATRDRWSKSQDWMKCSGSQMGYQPQTYDSDTYTKEEFTDSLFVGRTFVIPLAHISGLFNSEALIASHLASGLRVELVLSDKATVFKTEGNATVTGYTISAPEFRLETSRLSDSVMNQITQNSANGGLVITINTWDLTESPTTDSANIEVRRNVSQTLGVFVKSRITTDITAPGSDSMASEQEHKVSSYRLRLGSTFIPNSKVIKQVEHYALAQMAFNKFKMTSSENSVSVKSYLKQGRSIIASDLERSSLDLSGVSISNSKILAVEMTFSDSVPRTTDVYIEFTRVLTVFLSNTLVED
tara:strand:+ start:254 stop:1513 length:1260 start_codon:yes stop_codon:yes gene_type:complete